MRKGILCGVVVLLAAHGLAQAQPWQGYPVPYGYPGTWGYGPYGRYYSPQYQPVPVLRAAYPYGPAAPGYPPQGYLRPPQGYLRPPQMPASVMAAYAHPAPVCNCATAAPAAPCCGHGAVVTTEYPAPPCCCEPDIIEDSCAQAVHNGRVWVDITGLAAWTRAAPTPPLATLGGFPPTFTGMPPIPAALGTPGTTVVLGATDFSYGFQYGAKIDAGVWLDCEHHFTVEGGGFWLPTTSTTAQTTNPPVNSSFILARPFLDVSTGIQAVAVVSAPFEPFNVTGSVVAHTTQELWGAELNTAVWCHPDCPSGFKLLAGLRYLQMTEGLRIDESVTALAPGALAIDLMPVNSLLAEDNFETTNRFIGFQLGGDYRWRCCRVSTDFWAKCAVGATQENVTINGFTTGPSAATGATITQPGGVLALSSNIGNYTRNAFSVVPEAGVTVSADLTKWLTLRLGWSFLYWSNVVRPGDQINLHLNPNLIPYALPSPAGPGAGAAQPSFNFNTSNFWADFFTLGLEVRF